MNNNMLSTRDKILYISAGLFAKNGYDQVSMRSIALNVGIKASSIYCHFKNKEEIVTEIIKKYSTSIEKYYPTEEEMRILAKDFPAMELLKRFFVVFDACEYDFMLHSIFIIYRERFNKIFIKLDFYNKSLNNLVEKLETGLNYLASENKIKECDIHAIALIFTYTQNFHAEKYIELYCSEPRIVNYINGMPLSSPTKLIEKEYDQIFAELFRLFII